MINRLKKILEYYKLSASSFAEKIDVPRSSISHLLSGRNKASLDFIMKIDKAFDEVNLDWLLYGNGSFPSIETSKSVMSKNEISTPSLFPEIKNEGDISEKKETEVIYEQESKVKKQIKKIVILYTDGTFEDYNR